MSRTCLLILSNLRRNLSPSARPRRPFTEAGSLTAGLATSACVRRQFCGHTQETLPSFQHWIAECPRWQIDQAHGFYYRPEESSSPRLRAAPPSSERLRDSCADLSRDRFGLPRREDTRIWIRPL